MGRSNFLRLLSLFLVLLFSTGFGAFDPDNPDFDSFLIDHVIYATRGIEANWDCKSPKSGLFGTPGIFNQGSFTLQTDGYINELKGSFFKLQNNSNLEYVSKAAGITVQAGSNATQVPSVYSTKPQFPDISNLNFTGSDGTIGTGNHSPGNYTKLNLPSNSACTLNAGTYYFDEIELGSKSRLTIVPSSGDYSTRIYVKTKINLLSQSHMLVADSTGYGKVLLMLQSNNTLTIEGNTDVAPTKISATIIAENATVAFKNAGKLYGQVLADSISLIGFDGGTGVDFTKLITSNISVTPPDYFREDRTVAVGAEQTPHQDNTYNDSIWCSLTKPVPAGAGNWVKLLYTITPVNDGDAFNDIEMLSGKFSDTLTFTPTVDSNAIGIKIIDDAIDDNDETFTITFDSTWKSTDPSMDNYKINLDDANKVHTIKIIDDDPSNVPPSGITLSPDSLHEDSIGLVGALQAVDSDISQGDTHSYTIVGGADQAKFEIKDNNKLHTTTKFDYETQLTAQVSIRTTDSKNATKDSTFTIIVRPMNDIASVAVTDGFKTPEATLLNANSGSNDSDADKPTNLNTKTYKLVNGSTYPKNQETFNLNSDGTFSYKPKANFVGIDTFYYQIEDGANYSSWGYTDPTINTSNTVMVQCTVTAVNNNDPIVSNKTLSLDEGDSTTVASLFTDGDLPNDSHTITIDKNNTNAGTATAVGTSIKYVTSQNVTTEIFKDTIEFTVKDEADRTGSGKIFVTINKKNDNNPNPVVDTITVTQGDLVSFTNEIVDVNDQDIDLPSLETKLSIVSITGENATYCQSLVIKNRNEITYTVKANAIIPAGGAWDTLVYTINDSTTYDTKVNTGFDSVFVKIARNSANAPVALEDTIKLDEGKTATTLTTGSSNVMTNNDAKTVADLDKVEVLTGSGPTYASNFTLNSDGTFTYTHDDSENFSDSFRYILYDKAGYTDTTTVTIQINPLNDNIPNVTNETASVVEGKSVDVTVIEAGTKETDVDINTTFVPSLKGANGGAKYGTVTAISGGVAFKYTQDKDATGKYADTVVIEIKDETSYDIPNVHTVEDTIFITITPSNDFDPTVTDLNITIKEQEDTVINLSSLIDDKDLPDDVLTLSIKTTTTTNAGNATADNSNKTVSYQASTTAATEIFTDVVTYTVTDDAGHATDGTITINIEKLNDNNPVAVMDTVDVYVGKATTITPLTNDTDADLLTGETTIKLADPAIVTNPTKANTTISRVNDNVISITYDPAVVTASSTDSFEYKIEDPVIYENTVNSANGWVFVNIVFPDSADPIANDDAIVLDENASTSSLSPSGNNVMTNDAVSPKTGAALDTVRIIKTTTAGVTTLNGDGTFTYDHDDNKEVFFDYFTYVVVDVAGRESAPATVSITINKKNDNLPSITDDVLTVDEGAAGTVDILANDSDLDIQTVWVTSIAKQGTYGTVVKNADETFTYTHDGSENTLVDTFFVEVKDSVGYDATINIDTNIVVVTINAVNENTPDAKDSIFSPITEGESSALDISSLISDTDLPNDALTVTLVNSDTPAGSAIISGTIITYTHDITTEIFTDQIVYKVTDADGKADNGTLSITIQPINDNNPVIVNDTISVRQGTPLTFTVTGNDSDADLPIDSTFLKILTNGTATKGSVVKVDDSTFTYTMDINFEIIDGVSDVDSFTYVISDSVGYDTKINSSAPGMVFINLLHDEQGYPKTLNDSLNLKENESVTTSWSIMDNDTLGFAALKSINIVDDVDHGVLTIDPATGTFTYDHDDTKEEFVDEFIYTLTDSVGNVSNAALVSITIDTLNDNAPVVTNETLSVDEGAAAQINILTTETDADIATTLTPTLLGANGGATNGTVSITSDGTLTYIQDGTEGVTSDMVIINITDVTTYDIDGLHTVPDTVFITVNPLNNKTPNGTAKAFTLNEGETLAITDHLQGLLHDATDADLVNGNTLSAVLVTKPFYHDTTVSPFTLNADGTFTYIHDDSENFSDSLVFDISDGVNTFRLTATFAIAPVNDNAPVAQNDTYVGIEGGTISPVTSVLENDSDIDLYLDGLGGTITTPLHAVAHTTIVPSQGTVSITPAGLFTYTHNGSETVNDSFAYVVVDTMQGITFTDTAMVYITIPQVAPTADSAFYYDEDGNGQVEKVVVYFNDSINVASTSFGATWDEDAAVATVLSAVNSGTNGTEVTLTLDATVAQRTSGLMSIAITHGALFDNLVATIKAQDKAAPTIKAATFYYDETGNDNDSIRVFFSEDVSSFLGNPYNYFDASTGAEFSMEISPQSHVGSVVTYAVTSKTIKHVNTGDSIQINIANIAADTLENYQDLTIWAPITLEGKYPQELELLVVPQPMLFVKVTDSKNEAAPLNSEMMEYYNFPSNVPTKGVAFILTGKVPLGALDAQEGTYTILDQTGNVVQEAKPMSFTVSSDSKVTGVAVWEGKNKNGRTVAKSSYLCIVTVNVITENGEVITKEFKKPIATFETYK